MKCEMSRQPSLLPLAMAFVCLCLPASITQANDLYFGRMKSNRILFLGNSITYHGAYQPYEQYGWVGPWGMAASAPEKDYVHVLMNRIAGQIGAMPETMVTNIAEFEWNYATYDIAANLQAELNFKPDIVILAIGENVTSLTQSGVSYGTRFSDLLDAFQSDGQPTIFTRSSFWADPGKDGLMKAATLDAGGQFVDISRLGQDPLNYASAEPYYHGHSGILAHPGDRGMEQIADAIFATMVAHSVPEPGSLWLLLTGSFGLACYVWRRVPVKMFLF